MRLNNTSEKTMQKVIIIAISLLLLTMPQICFAGYTETLPMSTFLIEEAFVYSWVSSRWDNDGNKTPIIDEIDRYEPGGGKQGVLSPNAKAEYMILISKLQYGIIDDLTIGIGVPVVLSTKVDPRFEWIAGDYQRQLGRKYDLDDFWAWAGSMGQQKIEPWSGNKGVMSDIVVALRYNWTRRIEALKETGFSAALTILGTIPTGNDPDPEEPVTAGTTMWDLHTQGDLCFHLGFDKKFNKKLDGRLTLGLDLFYETFFDRELRAGTGESNPLLQTQSPFVGETYKINPGDFSGFAFQIDVVPYRGPAWRTWISGYKLENAEKFPPIISLSLTYSFVHLQQTHYMSDSEIWDWDKEEDWRPGYKNILGANLLFSFLRLGVPLQVYLKVRTLSLIPGKNARAADMVAAGIRIPLKFW